MSEKTGALARYSQVLASCSACGLCLSACPVFALTGLEPDGPRGKVLAARSLVAGKISPQDAVMAIARCLLCGKCEKACPSRLPLVAVFLAARQDLTKFLPISARRRLFFRLLAKAPQVLDFLQPPLALLQKALKSGSSLPKIAFQPFSAPPPGDEKKAECRVLLFSGCLARRIFPEIAAASAEALESRGVAVLAPSALVCCGRPLALQGDRRRLTAAVKKNLALLATLKFDYLATPCPGCLATIGRVWPALDGLDDDQKRQAAYLAEHSLDINSFLDAGDASSKKIFWRKPCLLGDEAEAAALNALGLETERENVASCCGAPCFCLDPLKARERETGRGYLAEMLEPAPPTLADALARQIRADAAGSAMIATACPGCRLALGKIAPMPVRHSAEIFVARKRDAKF